MNRSIQEVSGKLYKSEIESKAKDSQIRKLQDEMASQDESIQYEQDDKGDQAPPEAGEEGETYTTRYGRISRPPERWNLASYESILEPDDHEDWTEWCEGDLFAFNTLAMKASRLRSLIQRPCTLKVRALRSISRKAKMSKTSTPTLILMLS